MGADRPKIRAVFDCMLFLQAAARRLHLDEMSARARARVELLHGSLTYTDGRLRDFDVAAVVEVIEHLENPRAFVRELFGQRPEPWVEMRSQATQGENVTVTSEPGKGSIFTFTIPLRP